MEIMMGYCGLNCAECDAYKATINKDEELRKATAAKWGVSAEYVNCLGCRNEEVLCEHCRKCEVKNCNKAKNLDNCGLCDSYPCDRIEKLIKVFPHIKNVLDEIHSKR